VKRHERYPTEGTLDKMKKGCKIIDDDLYLEKKGGFGPEHQMDLLEFIGKWDWNRGGC